MSYHLRALERWGLIARAEGSQDARERPWRALGTSVRIVSEGSSAASSASSALLGQLLDTMREELLRNADLRARRVPQAWPTEFSATRVTMTDAEARDLYEEIQRLVRRYDDRMDPPSDARRHHVWWAGSPVEETPS